MICQQKKTQINKYNNRKSIKIFDHDHKVGDKVMLDNHAALKYETPCTGPFVITQCWITGTVVLQYGPKNNIYNIIQIKLCISDANVEYINPENMYDDVNI